MYGGGSLGSSILGKGTRNDLQRGNTREYANIFLELQKAFKCGFF